MRASRVRQRILTDHEHLRGLLDEVDRQALGVAQGTENAVVLLRTLGLQLLTRFSEHLALEDRVLAPALRRAGPGGREQAEQLDADHREQRVLLDYILGGLRDRSRPAAVLATEWRSLVELLLADMAEEELTILEGKLLTVSAPAEAPTRGAPESRSAGR